MSYPCQHSNPETPKYEILGLLRITAQSSVASFMQTSGTII